MEKVEKKRALMQKNPGCVGKEALLFDKSAKSGIQ